MVVNLIGVPFILIGLIFCLRIKSLQGRFKNFFMPFLTSLCWLFFIIPFLVIIPTITIFMENSGSDYSSFLRSSIAFAGIIIIIAVSVFSVLMNIIMGRLDFEKKMRFVSEILRKVLKKNAVKSDRLTLSRLFEQFKLRDEESFRIALLDRNPVNWLDFHYFFIDALQSQNLKKIYQKILVTKETFILLKQKAEYPEEFDEENQKQNLCEKIVTKLCGDKKKENKEINIEELRLHRLQEQDLVLVDDFLPKVFRGRNMKQKNQIDLADQMDQKHKALIEEMANAQDGIAKKKKQLNKKQINQRNNFCSEKTKMFMEKKPPEKISNYKATDHAQSLKDSQSLISEWLDHLFDQFQSEKDPENAIIYNDLKQMLRISKIMESDENFLLDQDEFEEIFEKFALVPHKLGFYCMNNNGFAQFLVEIAQTIFNEEKQMNANQKFQTLICNLIYPNIMSSFPKMAINYKSGNRFKQISPLDTFQQDQLSQTNENSRTTSRVDKYQEAIQSFEKIQSKKFINLQQLNSSYNGSKGSPSNALKKQKENQIINQKLNQSKLRKSQLDSQILQLEQSQIQQQNKNDLVRFCLNLGNFFNKLTNNLKKFLKVAKKTPGIFIVYIKKKIKQLGVALGFTSEDVNEDNEDEGYEVLEQKYAPSWQFNYTNFLYKFNFQLLNIFIILIILREKLTDIIIETMISAEEQYHLLQQHGEQKIHLNLSNILVLITRCTDTFNLANYAFTSQIPWSQNSSNAQQILEGGGFLYDNFLIVLYCSLGIAALYCFIAIIALKHAKQGTLGLNIKTGKNAAFPHRQFFLSKGIGVLGNSLFVNIFLDSKIFKFQK